MIDTVEELISNGVILSKDKTLIEKCAKSIKGVVIIPDSIKGFVDHGYGFGFGRLAWVDVGFKNCTQLTHVSLPSSFKSIDEGVFDGCTNLIQIDIPDSVNHIGCAFKDCKSLHSIKIPQSVTVIDPHAFLNLNIYIEVDENNGKYTSLNGSLYDKCGKTLLKYYSSKVVEDVVIDSKIEKIGECAFSGCITVKAINIPDSVKHIGALAFSQCVNLQEIRLPKDITTIESCSFYNCEKISKIIIPENIKKISDQAFKGCKSLFQIDLKGAHVEIIENAFEDCCLLKEIYGNIDEESFLFTHLADSLKIQSISSNEKKIIAKDVFNGFATQLKAMSILYHSFGMNITKIRGNCADYKSFKALDKNWSHALNDFFDKPQSNEFILSESWYRNSGIGLVLGWNRYRAIDVDNVDVSYLENESKFRELIDSFLMILKLPKDYPWVVKSGSGRGFHIIFKCDDLKSDFASKSYSPNLDNYIHDDSRDPYRYTFDFRLFERLELRWRDHLILPPSIHHTGNIYKFHKKTEGKEDFHIGHRVDDNTNNTLLNQLDAIIPPQEPLEISINSINNLILNYCGRIKVKSYSYNNISFKLVELCKSYSQYDSWSADTTKDQKDSIDWIDKCDSPEALNSLALKYVIGDEVDCDAKKARIYFTKSNCDLSYFNIASLIACGFFDGTYSEVEDYLARIDDVEQFSDKHYNKYSFRQLRSEVLRNAKELLSHEYYLFFDTETTGIPKDYKAPSSDVENWPRLVQIAWILTDQDGNRINARNYIIKPENFVIPIASSNIHGITTQKAIEKGILIKEALDIFLKDFNKASFIVGHNIAFDKKIVGAELVRLDMKDVLDSKTSICTMQSSIDLCKIPSFKGYEYKYPKLQELHKKLFGIGFDDAHNAMSDIEATEKCFWELKKRNLL